MTSLLGRGGMGVVYRCEHRHTGAVAAVKTVRVPSSASLAGIRREVHALSRLRHPGVARIVDEGVHEGLPFYAMDLYQGETLRRHIDRLWSRERHAPSGARAAPRRADPITTGTAGGATETVASHAVTGSRGRVEDGVSERIQVVFEDLVPALTVLRGVCEPLAFLHGEGLVHRDLKPDNVLVRPGGQPVLVDLGIAGTSGAAGREEIGAEGAIVGSVAYMAPEQIRGELVDARADLYALGAALYEVLTGRPPFLGTTQAVLYQHLSEPPPPPSRLAPGLLPALDDLVLRLLAKRPDDRLGYAADVDRALAALGVPAVAMEGAPRPRAYLYRPGLAGRADVLGALRAALDRTETERRGQRILVGGESGIGKTRLALELTRAATQGGLAVITGQCVALGTSGAGSGVAPPFHPFRPLLAAIADHCRAHPERTASLVGDRGKLLAPYAPELLDLPEQRGAPDPAALPPDASRRRILDALREMILAFAAEAPLLLLVDDMQWADELSLALVRTLSGEDFARSGVLFVGLYRAEEARGDLLEIVRAAGDSGLLLERLDVEGVGEMVSGMLALREAPRGLVELLHERCGGNPFFVSEYLRVAVEREILGRDGAGRWQLRAVDDGGALASSLGDPRSIADLLERRLVDLDGPSRALVTLAAVFGREVEGELLLAAAALDETAAMEAVLALRFRQILEAGGGDRLRFTHDELREAVYKSIPEEERRRLHRRAAEAIEAAGGGEDRWEALAFHHARAGARAEAARYAELAGRRALAAGAFRKAAEHLAVALDRVDGRRSAIDRGELLTLYARALHDVGDLEASARRVLEAMDALGVARVPQGRAGWGALLAGEVVKQAAHRALPSSWIEVKGERREAYVLSTLATRSLALHYMVKDRLFEAAVLMLLEANVAERSGDASLMKARYARLGLSSGMAGAHGLARFYFEKARRCPASPRDVAYEVDHALPEAFYWFALRAEWRRGRAILEPLLERCMAAGDAHQTEQANVNLALLSNLAGDGRAREPAAAACASAERHGHGLNAAWGRQYLGGHELLAGNPGEAVAHFERAERYFEDSGGASHLLDTAAGIAAGRAQQGDLDGALEKLAEARAAVAGRRRVEVWCTTHNLLAPDIYLAAWSRALDRGEPAAAHRELAAATARSVRRAARTFPALVPSCLRADAHIDALGGLHRRARRALGESVERARTLEMPHQEALSCALLAALAVAAPIAERRRALARATEIFRALRGPRGAEAPELAPARRALRHQDG